MDLKEQRIAAASQTLQAFKNGYYEVDGLQVDLEELHNNSLSNIKLYTPDMTNDILLENLSLKQKPVYRLSSLPVVTEFAKMKNSGKNNIGILNFASAKNPGGGFLNGALAQEESLAMCSNLYLTQVKQPEYYEANRACHTMLYTDYMIYSKDVVFIRENAGTLWKTPLMASVLTAPAVNMGQYLSKELVNKSAVEYAEMVMKYRMRKILQVFAEQKNEVLILGAYGCGVFRNDPKRVVSFFIDLLKSEGLEKYFKELVFAVYDSSKDKKVYKAFHEGLLPYLSEQGEDL